MTDYLIVPGLGNSPANHWQSVWEAELRSVKRIEQADWDHPDLDTWLNSFEQAVSTNPGAVLIGHSLGCALVAHAAARLPMLSIRAALLVAPADIERPFCTSSQLLNFAPMPREPLPFPSIVVASSNDPYATIARSREFARWWGSRFVDVGPCGHINAAAGFGVWPGGLKLLDELTENRCRLREHGKARRIRTIVPAV